MKQVRTTPVSGHPVPDGLQESIRGYLCTAQHQIREWSATILQAFWYRTPALQNPFQHHSLCQYSLLFLWYVSVLFCLLVYICLFGASHIQNFRRTP